MDYPPVIVTHSDGVAWLTLNRPEAMNALNLELLRELRTVLASINDQPAVCVAVLTGSGADFCTGADFKCLTRDSDSLTSESVLEFVKFAHETIELIPSLSKPVIAAVNGYALAGGLELAMACDFIIAARSARLGDGHAKYGLLPGAGGAARLSRIVGPSSARYLAFTGDSYSAAELLPLGLVNEIVDDGQLEARADELAKRIASNSTSGLAHMKRLINDGLEKSLNEAFELEQEALKEHVHSVDFKEGITAFLKNRNPKFADSTSSDLR